MLNFTLIAPTAAVNTDGCGVSIAGPNASTPRLKGLTVMSVS